MDRVRVRVRLRAAVRVRVRVKIRVRVRVRVRVRCFILVCDLADCWSILSILCKKRHVINSMVKCSVTCMPYALRYTDPP
jgi:hypothetical protein